VNDRRVVDGERQKFTSEILPPYLRRSKAVSEVLPVLYLRGLSTGDFREGLAALLGENAAGLSPSAITRLTSSWQEEYRAWRTRPLADRDYVYVWADGVHFNVRLEDERLAALVVIGARCSPRRARSAAGCTRSPTCSTSYRRAFSRRRRRRCTRMMNAPTKVECEKLVDAFVTEHEAKYPKAAKALATENDKLMTHFELPAEHWKHLRTTNPIESTFATVKLRQRLTKGAGSRGAGLAMAHRLLLLAERTWRRLDGHELLPLVRPGEKFKDGAQVERNDGAANKGKRGKIAA